MIRSSRLSEGFVAEPAVGRCLDRDARRGPLHQLDDEVPNRLLAEVRHRVFPSLVVVRVARGNLDLSRYVFGEEAKPGCCERIEQAASRVVLGLLFTRLQHNVDDLRGAAIITTLP